MSSGISGNPELSGLAFPVATNLDVKVPAFPGIEMSADGKSFRIANADRLHAGDNKRLR